MRLFINENIGVVFVFISECSAFDKKGKERECAGYC
jgi:hypothetical protein